MQPLIVIVGETASGKSRLALDIAKRFNGEIICADSWTVYKGFDIGTAKPTIEEQKAVPHHLIDIVDAADGFNAALYQRLANEAIKEILDRNRLPVLVGGTGLYVDSVIYNYSFLPNAGLEIRKKLNAQSLEELLAEALAKDINLDGIDIRNKRRVIRALETGGMRPQSSGLRPDTLVLGIKIDKENLHQRVTERVESMLKKGLEQEVSRLKDKYDWEAEPMKGIGYREWREYFDGSKNIDEVKNQIISATLSLAKRQRTWLKRNKSIHWVDDPKAAVDLATTFLNKYQ